jgi:hypothetical protein
LGVGLNYVTAHALRRIRERWKAASTAPQTRILDKVAKAIERATEHDELIKVPGGTYVPFSYGKEKGYLVLKKKTVITAIGAQWCPEVNLVLERRRNGQVRTESAGVPSDAA